MKRKIFSILFAVVLVLSLGLVTATPVAAQNSVSVPDRVTAITATADRLVALQSTESLGALDPPDFGWDWKVTDDTVHSGSPSASNLYGVTALGLIDAYEVTGDPSYLDAAGLVADMMIAFGIDYHAFYDYGDMGLGYSSDLRLLMSYAEASNDTTYSDFAKGYWAWVKDFSANYEDGNQEQFYQCYVDWVGHGFAVWGTGDFGLAALEMGDPVWASNMAAVLASHLGEIAETDECRFIGWGKALEFLNAVDPEAYATEIDTLITNLTESQNDDGSWGTGENVDGIAQDAAYAIMGLVAVGEREAAEKGAAWLVANQGYGSIIGGWNNSTDNIEYSETDSEALQALVATAAPVTIGDLGYYSIQDAIDSASEYDTINVAAGIYAEHIVITEPNLTLIGEDRETTIIDATQDQDGSVAKPGILIGEYPLVDGVHGVKVSGFTIRDAEMQEGGDPYEGEKYGMGPQAQAGILIYNNSNNTIENNILSNNHWQIFVCAEWPAAGYTECMNNRIADNIIMDSENDGVYLYSDGGVFVQDTEIVNNKISNAYGEQASGIEFWGWPEGGDTPTVSGTVIRGNNITSCTYGFRIRDEVSDVTGTLVRFNNFIGSTTYGVYNGVPSTIDATSNWWGTTDEAAIAEMISGDVAYSPWIGAGVEDSKSEETVGGDDIVVDATDETDTKVVKKGTGTPTITVTEYTDNPGGDTPGGFESAGKYIDVHLDTTENVTEIEIRNYYTSDDIAGLREESLTLSWWNGTDWIECSNSGVTVTYPDDDPYRGYVWAIIGTETTPTLADLEGTAFMSMANPAPTGGGGGFRLAPAEGTTDIRGEVNPAGVFEEAVTAASEDELCTLTIAEGTVGLTEELEPLREITIVVMDEPPPPPEDAHIIGLAYDFGPDGATFDPAVTLTWSYDPDALPEGDDLVIAYYDGAWVELEGCVVDTENNTITADVSHFTTFAIIARAPVAPPIAPPPEEPPAPPPEEPPAPPEEAPPTAPPPEAEAPAEVPERGLSRAALAGIIAAVVTAIAVPLGIRYRRRRLG
ncbi:hypothetical protein ES707_21473 [subsurface metagenome]